MRIESGRTVKSERKHADILPVDGPSRFVKWMSAHQHKDRRFGYVYRYHSRSDAHSIALCEEIVRDLLQASDALREHAARGVVFYDINCRFTWPALEKPRRWISQ